MDTHTQDPGFLSRNWKWLLPLGCLAPIVALALFVGGIVLVVGGAIRTSDPFNVGVQRARESPDVVASLGEPIEVGWLISGNINVNGPSGEANLSIPLTGPKGAATLYVVAEKSAGEWVFERLEVEIEGASDRVDLLGTTEIVWRPLVSWSSG